MATPLVSIIIPTFNRGHLLKDTIDSVLNQTYQNWECILVDDGAIDNTETVLEHYTKQDQRIKYVKRPADKNKGANACRNYGFLLSKGKYINWFDDDDLMHHDKLKLQVEALENSAFQFTVCQTLVFENTLKDVTKLRHPKIFSDNAMHDYISREIIWMTPSALWSKAFLSQFDYLFDEELQAAQEWEFHSRMLFYEPAYHVINEPLVYIRQHNSSITHNNQNSKREFHYNKAREKVYKFLKKKSNESTFLISYFISKYKEKLKSKAFKKAFTIYRNYILFSKKLPVLVKFKLFCALPSYLLFNKGEYFFKREN